MNGPEFTPKMSDPERMGAFMSALEGVEYPPGQRFRSQDYVIDDLEVVVRQSRDGFVLIICHPGEDELKEVFGYKWNGSLEYAHASHRIMFEERGIALPRTVPVTPVSLSKEEYIFSQLIPENRKQI